MTPLAVVAYPTFSDADRQWIEGLRSRYDPQASRIAAHVTLVFPTEVPEAPLVAQVRHVLRSSAPTSVVLRGAAVSPDAIGSGYYVSLIVDEGRDELCRIHDALYPGIPFVPHVTIGAHRERGECEGLADRTNEERRLVRAQVESLDVIEVQATRVRTVAMIPLGE